MPLFGRPTARDDARAAAWREWFARRNPLAIASLVLGIFSLIEFGALFIFGIAGIALGIVALLQLKKDSERPHGQRLAWSGIVISAASLIIAMVWIYKWI